MSESFQHRQLTLARERRGLTKADLAERCSVDRKTVSEWESGRVVTPPVELLAEALGFPRGFFFDIEGTSLIPEQVSFRALTSMGAKQTRQTLATASLMARISGWLDRRFQTPDPDVPSYERDAAGPLVPASGGTEAAVLVRTEWAMGDRAIPDLMALIESKGVRVFALPPDVRGVDAFSVWLSGRPTIFLNTDKSAERLRFDLAHELGHLVMHRGVATVKNRMYESQANAFAGQFLVPSSALYAQVRGAPAFGHIFVLKKHFRISATALVFRLHECALINDWQYRTWMVELSKRGYRTDEPDGIEREHSQLLTAALRLAREDGYSTKSIASELNVPPADISTAFAGLVRMPVG